MDDYFMYIHTCIAISCENRIFDHLVYKKHIDASVKERPQTLLVPSEEICKRVLCNKHILHYLLFQTDKL